jgi:phenylalanine-4-hydroxylase
MKDKTDSKGLSMENGQVNGHESPAESDSTTKSRYMMNSSHLGDKLREHGKTNLIFSVKESVGALAEALKIFKDNNVSLDHIESRPCKQDSESYEFLVECGDLDGKLKALMEDLNAKANAVVLLSGDADLEYKGEGEAVPWFPKKISDLDEFANRILSCGKELDADHPGFKDPVYRKRRQEFAEIAINYRYGEKIPRVEYTQEEISTWATIFKELTTLYPTHACKEFNYAFPLLQHNCGYNENNIPQLQDVSDFLKDCTGFTLRPVAGLLSSRDFLAGLAFRVFHSTQYIRHGSAPRYTPEPDVCHEILGHVPLFADPDFAHFSQEIGLASIGASDEWIERLATLYWFTVEFGLCMQSGERKAYGAGLLSSFGELQYCLTNEPEVNPFDPAVTSVQKYPITKYQPTYFIADSFKTAKEKLKEWANDIPKPFTVHYDPYTQSLVLLDNKDRVSRLARDIKYELQILEDAIKKL